jgi:ABC-type Fe3+/spermidine/putrescine transport system ATPase subunit
MNRIPGHIEGAGVTVLGRTVAARNVDGRSTGTAVDVLVRPEHLTLATAPHGAGIVTTKTFLGSVTRVSVLLDGDTAVKVDQPSDVASRLDTGAAVEVHLIEDEVMVANPGIRMEPAVPVPASVDG